MSSLYHKESRVTQTPARQRSGRVEAAGTSAPKGVRIREAVEDYLSHHRHKGSSQKTVQEYAYMLDDRIPEKAPWLPLIAWCNSNDISVMSELDKDACNGWLTQMRSVGTKYTSARSVVMLKRFLAWAFDDNVIETLPLRLVEPKRKEAEIPVFSMEEMTRISNVVKKENLRDWAIFMMLLDTGMRANEIVTLRVQDVRIDKKELVVRSEISKTGKARVIPLNASIGPLKAWLRERGDVPGCDSFFLSFAATPVYAGSRSNQKRRTTVKSLRKYLAPAPLTRIGLYMLTQKWGQLAGVTEARNSPHTYRHFFAVTYLRQGGDVFTLKDLLGHSKLDMTLRYAKLAQVDVRRVHTFASPATAFLPKRQQRVEE